MARTSTIALAGGIPPSLGGGGMEMQRDRTAAALRGRGHTVFHIDHEPAARPFDLLHVFGSEIDACHRIEHWRRNPAPLVITPILVVPPGWPTLLLLRASRSPWRSIAQRQRADLLRRADVLVACTQNEAQLLGELAPRTRVVVIDNGVEPAQDVSPTAEGAPFVLLLGTVSARKRQHAAVRALVSSALRPVVVGGFDGDDDARARFAAAVQEAGGDWKGEIHDQPVVRSLLVQARALVHLSAAEGQSQAVLEALSVGTPVVCSPIPSNLELKERYPAHLVLCSGPADLPRALAELPEHRLPAPDVPTWHDVARLLDHEYTRLLG